MGRVSKQLLARQNAGILSLFAMGITSKAIAELLALSVVTVDNRLKALGHNPASTRENLIEQILPKLEPHVQEWLSEQVSVDYPMQTFLKDLIVDRYLKERNGN